MEVNNSIVSMSSMYIQDNKRAKSSGALERNAQGSEGSTACAGVEDQQSEAFTRNLQSGVSRSRHPWLTHRLQVFDLPLTSCLNAAYSVWIDAFSLHLALTGVIYE